MQILGQTLVSVFFNFTELIKAYGWKGNIKKLASLIWINSKIAPKGDLKITYANMKWRGFLNTLSPLTSHLPCFSQVCGLGPSVCEKKESPFSRMSLLLSLFCFSLVKLIGSATSKQTTIRCSMFDSNSTSSPGSSRFPIWRRQERRPWHTAEITWLICPRRVEIYSKWRPR